MAPPEQLVAALRCEASDPARLPEGHQGPSVCSHPDPAGLVVFDCDGTLVDSEPIASAVNAELLAARGVPLDAGEVLALFTGLSVRSTKALVAQLFGVQLDSAFDAEKARRLDTAFAAGLRPVPGMPELVGDLVAAGRPICVASSSTPERIETSLAITGLDRWFPPALRFSSVMVEAGKPAPDLFLLAAERLGADPGTCVVVEDSVHGVEAGVAAGMTVIGLTAGSHADSTLAARLLAAGASDLAGDAAALAALLDPR